MKLALALVLAACSSAPRHTAVRPEPTGGGQMPGEGDGNAPPQPQDPLTDDDGLHVIGAIPRDSIHRVVRENFASIRQCYEQVVMANPGLQGRVIAKFKVGLDGTVQDASATGVHPDLETCVATQVRKFKFPRPDKGDVVVEYPFVFKPG